MNLKELKQRMPALLNSGISIELISSPGLGKSELVDQVVEEQREKHGEFGFADLFLATQTPPDLLGFQFKGEVTWEGKVYTVTDPTIPTWFITKCGKPVFAFKRGILFLDEYGQGDADVKRASAELLLNKRIGKWHLPDGWTVIAASNRSSDRSGVTKSLDFVINRRLEINLTPSVEAWTEYAVTRGVMPLTIAFANQNPNIVFTGEVPDKQGPWCTPRSLVMADKLLQTMTDDKGAIPDDPLTVELVGGLIGMGATAQYFAFVKLEREMPKYERIVAEPKTVKVPIKPDALMLVAYNLAHRVDEKDIGPVVTYVERMPQEFGVTFLNAACKRKATLVNSPAVQKWALENSSLMAAIAK